MNKEEFGQFVSSRRKELGLTQKDLGEKLNITAGAVSKWERGLSYPDICMLEDLANTLEVTIVELLNGKKEEIKAPITTEQVEEIIDFSLEISDDELKRRKEKNRLIIIFLVMILMLIASITLNILNYSKLQSQNKENTQNEITATQEEMEEPQDEE